MGENVWHLGSSRKYDICPTLLPLIGEAEKHSSGQAVGTWSLHVNTVWWLWKRGWGRGLNIAIQGRVPKKSVRSKSHSLAELRTGITGAKQQVRQSNKKWCQHILQVTKLSQRLNLNSFWDYFHCWYGLMGLKKDTPDPSSKGESWTILSLYWKRTWGPPIGFSRGFMPIVMMQIWELARVLLEI